MSSQLEDKVLLYRLLIHRDPEAFTALYDRYVKQIYRFVYFKVRSHEEAEDLTADVFLKTWQYVQNKKEVKSFSGLLYRIARNCIIDLYRQKSANPEASLGEETEVGDGGKWYADVSLSIDSRTLLQQIKKLKQEYQEVVTLRYVDELTIEEIAEIIGKGQIAVRVTLHRALKKLKAIVEQPKGQ